MRERTYHHSRFRDQGWARKVSPDPWLQLHPETATLYRVAHDDWVWVETAGGPGRCRLKVRVTEGTLPGVARTGMGWWYPEAEGPHRGALEVNINAAMRYDGPWDPVTGSADTRGFAVPYRQGGEPVITPVDRNNALRLRSPFDKLRTRYAQGERRLGSECVFRASEEEPC